MSTEEVQEIKAKIDETWADQLRDTYLSRIKELAPREFFDIDTNGKTIRFRRRKILGKERFQLETLRQKLNKAASINSVDYPKLEDELYKKMAGFYLIDTETNTPMTPNQYDDTVFEDMKLILDALAFRTEKPIPMPSPLENRLT